MYLLLNFSFICSWHCWLGDRKGIQPVKIPASVILKDSPLAFEGPVITWTDLRKIGRLNRNQKLKLLLDSDHDTSDAAADADNDNDDVVLATSETADQLTGTYFSV